MTAQRRLRRLYDNQCAPADSAESTARSQTTSDEEQAVRWPGDRTGMLPFMEALINAWLKTMREHKTDIGQRRQRLERYRLILTWEQARWRRALPLWTLVRIIAYQVAIFALSVAISARAAWRWAWRNRRTILRVLAVLGIVTAVVLLITFLVTELPAIIRSLNGN